MKISKWPEFDEEQVIACTNVLRSGQVNYWTGNETKLFEEEFSRLCNCNYSVGIANGSLALSSAYLSIGIGKGDEIITTPRTFVATASSVVLLGAKPVFADVDRNSGAITAKTIEPLINKNTKAIVVVHLGGWPANMLEICDLAKKYNLKVIEDCSQAHGAKIKVNEIFQSVGSFGDISTWSFCQDKIMTTGGEGGMVTTNSKDLWDKVWSYKDHGKTLQALNRDHKEGFRWLHERFGSNFRITELQSSIGRVQIKRLKHWSDIRTKNARLLWKGLKDCSCLRIPLPKENLVHAWYKFHCYLNVDLLLEEWSRDRVISEINQEGYPAFSGSCSEVYLEKCFRNAELAPLKRLPNAKELGETSLMFLVHPTITEEQMFNYIKVIKSICMKASK